MLLGDLATIAQYKLPVKIIVFNNRSLGMVKLEMEVWTMTMCAASSPWAWTTSKSDAPKTLQALPHPAAERRYRKKGWYLL